MPPFKEGTGELSPPVKENWEFLDIPIQSHRFPAKDLTKEFVYIKLTKEKP